MGDARVGDAGHVVHLGQDPPLPLAPGHDGAVAVAHDLHVDPLVVGVGVAVVAPEEGADFHLLARGGEDIKAVGPDADNLPGAQLVGVFVAQLVVGEGLEGDAIAPFSPANENG